MVRILMIYAAAQISHAVAENNKSLTRLHGGFSFGIDMG